jgi:hypothetical protein
LNPEDSRDSRPIRHLLQRAALLNDPASSANPVPLESVLANVFKGQQSP